MTIQDDILLAIGEREAALPREWEALSELQRIAFARTTDPDLEDLIDAWLDTSNAPQVLQALARSRSPWTHPALDAVEDPEMMPYLAILKALEAPEVLVSHIYDADLDEPALDMALRALTWLEPEAAREVLEALHQECLEDDSRASKRLRARAEGMLAICEPRVFARRALGDEFEDRWVRSPDLMADLFAGYAPSSWLETLAILETGTSMNAFEFAGLLATCATLDAAIEPAPTQDMDTLIFAIRAEESGWDTRSLQAGFRVCMALGDQDMVPLLCEVAAHERLWLESLPSPGISGLPLSSNVPDQIDLEAARNLFAAAAEASQAEDELTVATVRTLCDLRHWHTSDPQTVEALLADPALEALVDHPNAAINLAARRAQHAFAPDPEITPPATLREALILGASHPEARAILGGALQADGAASMYAAHLLALEPGEEALETLALGFATCHPLRSEFIESLLRERLGIEDTST